MAKSVLYVVARAQIGGAELATIAFARFHSPMFRPVFLFLNDGPLVAQVEKLGIRCYTTERAPRLRRPRDHLAIWSLAKKVVKAEDIELVHCCMPYSFLFVRPAIGNLPTVLYQHGPVGGKLDKIASLLGPELILANSRYTLEEHVKSAWRSTPIEVCYLANMPALGSEESSAPIPSLPKKRLTIVSVARFDPWKGLELGLDAVAEILRASPEHQYWIVGGGKDSQALDYADELKNNAKALGIDKQVMFWGEHSNVIPFLENADIFLHTSLKPEPFGLVILEAISAHTKVVAANSGGVPEIFEQGYKGWLYEMGDSADAKKAIQSALDARLPAQPSQGQAFSMDRTISQLESSYLDLIETHV